MNEPQPSSSSLETLVRRYRVCFEVWPEHAVVNGALRQTGFRLELSGAHTTDRHHSDPVCPDCQEVFRALHRISEQILPREERPSMYKLGPDDHAIHLSPLRAGRPDVTLEITILHRGDLDDPVGACQVRCLTDMTRSLAQLGACRGRWTPRRDNP